MRPVFQGLALLILLVGCGDQATVALEPPPWPDLSRFDPPVAEALQAARDRFEQAHARDSGSGAQDWGSLGMHFHAHHLYPLAEECYRNALLLAPDDSKWRYYLAYVLQETGRFEEAASHYKAVIEQQPENLAAQLRLAETRYAASELQEAGGIWKAALAREPGNAAALAGLGRIALANGAYTEAEGYLRRALAAQPAATRLYHPLAMALRGKGELEAAAEALAQRGERKPAFRDPLMAEVSSLSQSAQYYLVPALKAAQAGRHAEAAGLFRKVLEIDPDDAAAHAALARVLESLGDLEGSMRATREALMLDPELNVARYQEGVLLERAGDDAAAIEAYRQVLEREPEYAEPRMLLANALMRMGSHREAATHYEALSEQLPGNLQVHYYLGLARLAGGQCQLAFTPLERASAINKAYGPVVEALVRNYASCSAATAAHRQQALADARWLFEQLKSPAFAEALAMALAANDAWDDAVALQRQLLAQGTDEPGLRAFREANLDLYRQQQRATAPWHENAVVYRPARISASERGGVN